MTRDYWDEKEFLGMNGMRRDYYERLKMSTHD